MKKLLTSVLTLALVLCCFTFVGCTKDKEKPATIEQTLAVCDQFIADMKAVETKISAQNYEYPTIDALRASKAVDGTDKSSIGIEYSNYMDFDLTYDFKQGAYGPYDTYAPSDFYIEMAEMSEYFGIYFDIYKNNNLQLNNTYKFDTEDDENPVTIYLKLINDNSRICLSMYMDYTEGGYSYNYDYIINLNNNSSWKSFELKNFSQNYLTYMYVEKATDNARIFNKFIAVENEETARLTDVDETTQKMLYIDEFMTDSMNVIQAKAYNYLESLNLEDIVDDIDTANATEIQVDLGE